MRCLRSAPSSRYVSISTASATPIASHSLRVSVVTIATIATTASNGTSGPPGSTKGVAALAQVLRCARHAARLTRT